MALSSNENSNSTANNARQPLIPGYNTSDERKALRNKLRAEAKQARSEMPAPYRAHKSAELCKRLEESLALTLGITGMNAADATIAVYAAFPEEVDLQDFIESAYTQGCKIAFPCMVRDAWNSSEHPNSTGVEQVVNVKKLLKIFLKMRQTPLPFSRQWRCASFLQSNFVHIKCPFEQPS